MFATLLAEYVILLVSLVLSASIIHLFVYVFTLGRGVRVFLAAIYINDFNSRASRLDAWLRRTAGALYVLLLLALTTALCASIFTGFVKSGEMGIISTVVASAFPAAYVLTYLGLTIKRYSASNKVLSGSWVWEGVVGEGFQSILREARALNASYAASIFCVAIIAIIPPFWAISNLVTAAPSSTGQILRVLGVELAAAAGSCVMLFMFLVADKVTPHRRVINSSIDLLLFLEGRPEGGGSQLADIFKHAEVTRYPSSGSFSPSRWRGPTHKAGFDLASSVEKVALSLRGRLAKDDFRKCYGECAKLAAGLRGKAIDARSPELRENYAEMVRCALAVVVADNPERVLPYIRNVTPNEGYTEPPAGRIILTLRTLNEHAEQAWGIIRIVGAMVAVTAIFAYGQWGALGAYFLR